MNLAYRPRLGDNERTVPGGLSHITITPVKVAGYLRAAGPTGTWCIVLSQAPFRWVLGTHGTGRNGRTWSRWVCFLAQSDVDRQRGTAELFQADPPVYARNEVSTVRCSEP
ncbi:hypothetical protein Zmor_022778 [Zophobas morio]|uniref:Uncharacterized protein n=1 Tax=Zophobas morio TaxID=2755281 RepID=A0AA38HX25_9CUCU|nr:hypothetical protein Zmor_022778 [Zophobas morio]